MDPNFPSTPSTPSAAPPPRPRGWWARNWKWFVPTGCLTLCALFAALAIAFAMIIFGAMKSSDAYKIAVSRAMADNRVIATIGTPITEGWLVSGNTNVNGGSGNADLSIPISGPKGKATIYATASKSAGRWIFSQLVVQINKTGERIELEAH